MCKYFVSKLLLAIVSFGFCALTAAASPIDANVANDLRSAQLAASSTVAPSDLRSAYLGASVWSEDLSSREVNDQLKSHFAEVLHRLESKNASGLLTALRRAEASSVKRWSKSERRAALIYLTFNRQLQIKRLRDYMNRGLFPLNEGQSSSAVPIFVDRHDTHCAVGHLMHSDGKDSEVAGIVKANNLVRILNVDGADDALAQWIRTSGLTKEEAAMIQPGYPVDLDATFQDLVSTTPVVQENGLTVSNFSILEASFNPTLPATFNGFQNDPTLIDSVLQEGITALNNNGAVPDLSNSDNDFNTPLPPPGILFGTAGAGASNGGGAGGPNDVPNNLSDWLYLGSGDIVFGGLIQNGFPIPNPSNFFEIFEIDYLIETDPGNVFSNFALTSLDEAEFTFGGPGNEINTETSALLILSEIFDGDTNQLLGEARLFATGVPNTNAFGNPTSVLLVDSDTISASGDSLRVRTRGVVAGSANIDRIFHEFEVSVPEPGSGIAGLLIGVMIACRRNRRLAVGQARST